MNPHISAQEREIVGLFIVASLEGMTVFAGYGKPYKKHMPLIKNISYKFFGELIRNLRPGEVEGALSAA